MGGLSLINVARDGAMWWAVVKTTDRREYAAASPRNARYNPWPSEPKTIWPSPSVYCSPVGIHLSEEEIACCISVVGFHRL